ncbi:hypothetical protein [Krasilnikovia sp. MM14-A1004]|uniref:hypothetical protein n=1 Tax=Krasilnikovia sp. MM14-A1004 TaxID=3373541 RepID=UPI00399C93BA
MIDYECRRCGNRGRVAEAHQLTELCHTCQAQEAWAALPAETWRIVGEDLARGHTIPAIVALRTAHSSISLGQAVNMVNYRQTHRDDR